MFGKMLSVLHGMEEEGSVCFTERRTRLLEEKVSKSENIVLTIKQYNFLHERFSFDFEFPKWKDHFQFIVGKCIFTKYQTEKRVNTI